MERKGPKTPSCATLVMAKLTSRLTGVFFYKYDPTYNSVLDTLLEEQHVITAIHLPEKNRHHSKTNKAPLKLERESENERVSVSKREVAGERENERKRERVRMRVTERERE